jgi:hypothetical protein
MTKNQFCAVLAFGFLLGMAVTDIWWGYQLDQVAAALVSVREPASADTGRR